MEIVVFSGFSKKINSTKRPSGGSTLNVKLKQPCSVMKPQFLISGFNTTWNYIEWGSRYYYVDDITIETNDLATYSCTLDVLATFRGDILGSTQYVTRSASTYNQYVSDGKYPALNYAETDYMSLSALANSLSEGGSWVVGLINPDARNGVGYYVFTSSTFISFMAYLFGDDWLDPDADILLSIQKELINPFQYIASCNWFPLALSGLGTTTTAKFGYWDSGVSCKLLSESDRVRVITGGTIQLPRHPQAATYGGFLNGSPFTRYSLECWCFGKIPIDPLPFVQNNNMSIRIEVDIFSGMSKLTTSAADGTRLNTITGQFDVPVQLSQFVTPVVAPMMSALSGAASIVAGTVTGNYVGAAVGGVSGIMDSIKSAMPQLQTTGTNGSKINFTVVPMISAEFYELPAIDNTHFGRPVCASLSLSGLSGFTQCENVALDTSASDEEKREIISYMTSGFYIE